MSMTLEEVLTELHRCLDDAKWCLQAIANIEPAGTLARFMQNSSYWPEQFKWEKVSEV